MGKIKPKLFSVLHHYTIGQFRKDMLAGIIVAIIALPLSIAFAIGSGVTAERGLYSAIISSFLVALLGGSRVQITGPTGAFIIITNSIIVAYGMDGLMIAMILAGLFLILMGFLRFGKIVRYIPAPITIGFTGGIAVTIFTLEVKDFLGLSIEKLPSSFFGKWATYLQHLDEINWISVAMGMLCVLVLLVWPRFHQVIPNSLVVLVLGSTLAYFLDLDVKLLGDVSKTLPPAILPKLSLDDIFQLVPSAVTIAILIALQALLSAVVTDSMINSKHNANMELFAEGVANIVLGFLGCIPATGGVARSIANAKNGARTPIAAIFHSITLFLLLFFGIPLLKYVPMCVLSAILLVVSVKMFHIEAFWSYRKAPKSDLAVLLSACIFTFAFDLVFAIEVGMVLACVLFMKRMSDVTEVHGWKYLKDLDEEDEEHDPDALLYKEVPKHTLVFEVSGPMFFGAADKLIQLTNQMDATVQVVIVRMRSVPAIDATAMNALMEVHKKLKQQNIVMVFSHVLEQPMQAMKKAGCLLVIGEDNLCASIDVALQRAAELVKE